MKVDWSQRVGLRFGRLVVRSVSPVPSKHRSADCVCDCGATVSVLWDNLRNGSNQSCGCLRIENRYTATRTHGESRSTPEYRSWASLRDRCLNPRSKDFPRYGGRGITVCQRWLEAFENFLADMGRRPSPEHSLDRVDVNAGYEPGNCRWATQTEQQRNRRNNHTVTSGGETLTVAEWAARTGIPASTLHFRLRSGWAVDRALSAPVRRWPSMLRECAEASA